ncbi:hypothetical protein GCM10022197_35860 [Microlunatus spumicola]|uniref:40-residue YVTN family beta-propeller repeat-containing protein n=1 Tax=Microlunatus spumicola TaxID=81499 RepID=A0ABP6Y0Y6_9ACTN
MACVLAINAPVGSAQATPGDPVAPIESPVSPPEKAADALAPAPSSAPPGTTSKITKPYVVTLDPATDTLYVAGRRDPARLFVLDARGCTVQQAQCRGPLASIPLGAAVLDIVVDPGSGTVYVGSSNGQAQGFVSVIDGRRCNARDVSGCGQAYARSLSTGVDTVSGLEVDPRRHTLYVAGGGFVTVFDTRTCNVDSYAGCSAPARARAGDLRAYPLLDETTDTLYLPHDSSVDVVDTRTCNATDALGCARAPATFPVRQRGTFGVVDHSTGTLYLANDDGGSRDGQVAVVDARRCNARTTAGCPTGAPRTARVGPQPRSLVVDPRTHSLYAVASSAGVVSVIDTRRCRARHTSGCRRVPKTVQTGDEPSWMTYDARTRSLYVANQSDDTVQVLDATRCSAVRSTGCRKRPRTAPATANSRVLPTVRTIYQGPSPAKTISEIPQADDTLSFLDTHRCNRRHRDCSARRSIELGYFPQVYVDPGSSTLYLVDAAADVVHLVDARRCNVSRRDGCRPFADVSVPRVGALTVNPRTHTVYATQEGGATTIAVLPGPHCNALDHTRCAAAAHEVKLGNVVSGIAVDDARDTVYVGIPLFQAEALLPSTACDAGPAGCVPVATTFLDGVPRDALAVPERHSLYVAGGFGADTLTVVDTATCNVHRLDGCVQPWPKTVTPSVPSGLVYDRRADLVVVAGSRDSTVALIDPKVCGAGTPSGCARSWPRVPVGFQPVGFGTDWRQNTLYVFNDYSETVTLLDLADPCRRKLCVQPPG